MVQELQIFQQHLSKTGKKVTQERIEIAKAFLSTEGHVTADELLQKLQQSGVDVGRATLYRTLAVLCEAGLAVKRQFDEGTARYERLYGHKRHDHLVCTRCGKIIEFESPLIERVQQEVFLEHDFLAHSRRVELYGLCKECRE
jgi:Fur family ferric uptake transcriptional regulator